MIEIVDLTLHLDARGWLFEGWTGDMAYWYATCAWPGVVKGWHRHTLHTDRLVCVSGLARIVALATTVTPGRFLPGTNVETVVGTREVVCGPAQPKLVVIPPGIWHGFQAIGGEPCVIVNAPDLPYDPADEERAPWTAFAFDWGAVNG